MHNTDRLTFRKFTLEDLSRLIEMRVDPDVMKYLGGEEMQNPKALKERLAYYISCYDKDIGMHAMLWKETGEMMGWSGLQPLEGTDEIEVSYGMIKEFWGKGIASEAAKFWLDFGFNQLNLKRIVAVADKENIGSWKIMEKLGMKYEKTEDHYGMKCLVYGVTNEQLSKALKQEI